MKFLKPFIFFLLAILAVTAILSMLMPVKQKIEKTITINAPASFIYQQLAKLENFNKYSIWSQRDSTAKYTMTGIDGTIGATSSWTGDPDISGEGKLEIVSLEENKKIGHKLSFSKPKKGNAESSFTLKEINGVTTVIWDFEVATPRPWNIFNLFSSLDKKMGKDFEESLATIKTAIEKIKGTAAVKKYDVQTMNFPATSFAIIRQQVKWADMSSFFEHHFPLIHAEALKVNASPGTASGLFYNWDEKEQTADVAAAFAVTAKSKIQNDIIQVITIPASKAVYVNYSGAYDKLQEAYASVRNYLSDNNLEAKIPSIEQYFMGPLNENDSTKWLTKIIFLVN